MAGVIQLERGVDHVRGDDSAPVILEYGDFECPYSRMAYREIEKVEAQLGAKGVRFAFRHFPLTVIHPHGLAASAAAEAAALQGPYWEMHDMLFHRQKALEDADLHAYAQDLGLDVERFDSDRFDEPVLARIRRDMESGIATGEVGGTPTIFIDGRIHRDSYEAPILIEAIASARASNSASSR